MIYLKSIYSEPSGLFESVKFEDGINIIFAGYKDENTKKGSLNSVGKSTLVKLINFCLLSSYDNRNKLYKAKHITDPYYIVLEIEIDSAIYTIKRSTSDQGIAFFGFKGREEPYKINTLKQHLTDLFFDGNNYPGVFDNKWFRKLIPFFIRDEFKGFNQLIDYIGGQKDLEMVMYNLYLLNIDNTLAYQNYKLRTRLKEKQKTQTEVVNIVKEKYDVEVQDINSKLDKLKDELDRIENSLKDFNFEYTFAEIEKDADEITKEIKQLIKKNYVEKDMLKKLEANIKNEIVISVDKIESMYKQIDKGLGIKIRKPLDEIIQFRRKLVQSRSNFLKEEISRLKEKIEERSKSIKNLNLRRSQLLLSLEDKGTVEDISNVVSLINDKNKEISDLNGKVSIYNDLQEDMLKIKSEEADLDILINNFLKEHQEEITQLRKIFNEIYNFLYKDNKGIFNISYSSKRKDAKFEIKAQAPDSSGWGKGRASILIYDLVILVKAIRDERNFPRFLIHDGIYNGVSRNQFVLTMNYLNTLLEKNYRFQYIFTANESDVWLKNEDEIDINLEKKKRTYYNDTNKIFDVDFS